MMVLCTLHLLVEAVVLHEYRDFYLAFRGRSKCVAVLAIFDVVFQVESSLVPHCHGVPWGRQSLVSEQM